MFVIKRTIMECGIRGLIRLSLYSLFFITISYQGWCDSVAPTVGVVPLDRSKRDIYFVKDSPNYLIFGGTGEKLVLDIPKGIDVLQAIFRWKETNPVYIEHELVDSPKGNNYQRYLIDVSKYNNSLNLIVFFEPENFHIKENSFYCHTNLNEEESKWKEYKINVLPELKIDRNCKRFKTILWKSTVLASSTGREELCSKLAQLYKQMGIGYVMGEYPYKEYIDKIQKIGIRYIHNLGMSKDPFLTSYVKDLSDEYRCRDREGKIVQGGDRIPSCPSYFLEKGEALYPHQIERATEAIRNGAYGFQIDHEPGDPLTYCFCKRCLKYFSEYSGLDISKLSGESIYNNYQPEWMRFRAYQLSKAMQLINEEIKKVNPETKFIMVSHYIPYSIKSRREENAYLRIVNSSDLIKYDKHVDMHAPMMYGEECRAFFDYVDINTGMLKKSFMPLRSIGMADGFNSVKKENLRLDMFSCATGGAKGFCIYHVNSLDGEHISTIAKTNSDISLLEDYFFDGERVDEETIVEGIGQAKGFCEDRDIVARTYVLRGKILVTLFNFTDVSADILVKFPRIGKKSYHIIEPLADKVIASPNRLKYWDSTDLKEGVKIQLARKEVKTILLEPQTVSRIDIKDLDKCHVREDFWGGMESIVLENSKIKVTVVPEDMGRIMEIISKTTGHNQLALNSTGVHDIVLIGKETISFRGLLSGYPYDYDIIQDKNKAVAIVYASKGKLKLVREMTIFGEEPRLNIKVDYLNIGKSPIDTFARIHPAFNVGEGKVKEDIVLFATPDEIQTVPPGKDYWDYKPNEASWGLAYDKDSKEAVIFTYDQKEIDKFYFWRKNAPFYTLEYWGIPATVEPGKKISLNLDFWIIADTNDIKFFSKANIPEKYKNKLIEKLNSLWE